MPGEHARLAVAIALIASLHAPAAWAGAQMYEPLSASVRSALSRSINHETSVRLAFANPEDGYRWLATMSRRLEKRIPDPQQRLELLRHVHYEATRAGLEPELVLAVIDVESNFNRYAISSAGALGLMQIMPFWLQEIGQPGDNLFHIPTNLRFGCTILRYYLDMAKGDLTEALARYNGSYGRYEYPGRVFNALNKRWFSQ